MKLSRKLIIFLLIIVAATTATICYLLCIITPAPENEMAGSNVKEKNYAQILLVGDLMFDRGIRYYAQQNGGNDFIFEKISPTLLENDLVVANLEGPITPNKSVSAGTAPGSTDNYYFTFDPSVAETLFKQNIRIVSLGNNHILNFGRQGLASTKNYLDKAKVGYFGAPDYPKSASIRINGIDITFISYNEFSALQDLEPLSTVEEIEKAKGFSDIIIVYCHWGVEYSLTPTEQMKTLGRQFIDAGADLVVGAHPHVLETPDFYNQKRIYYSLGNFIFDQYFNESVRTGMALEVKIYKETKQLEFEEKKLYLQNNGQTILAK